MTLIFHQKFNLKKFQSQVPRYFQLFQSIISFQWSMGGVFKKYKHVVDPSWEISVSTKILWKRDCSSTLMKECERLKILSLFIYTPIIPFSRFCFGAYFRNFHLFSWLLLDYLAAVITCSILLEKFLKFVVFLASSLSFINFRIPGFSLELFPILFFVEFDTYNFSSLCKIFFTVFRSILLLQMFFFFFFKYFFSIV